MTVPYQVTFAFNTTQDLSTATIQTFTIAWAKATSIINSVYHTLVNYNIIRDQVSKGLRLEFKLGRDIINNPTYRAFFIAFFESPCKWAVYGNFKDVGNIDNLCLCDPPSDFNQASSTSGNIVDVSMAQDASGYILISSGVTITEGSSAGGSGTTILDQGSITLDGTGIATISSAYVTTVSTIFLSRDCGRGGAAIHIESADIVPGISAIVRSDDGSADAGLVIGWVII